MESSHLTCVWKSWSQCWSSFVLHNLSSKLAIDHLNINKKHQKLVAKWSQLIAVSHSSSRAVKVIFQKSQGERSKSPSQLQISFFPFRCAFKQAHKKHSIDPRILEIGANWARKVDFSSVMDSPLQGVWKYVLFYLQQYNTLYLTILHAHILLSLIDAIFVITRTLFIEFIRFLHFCTHLFVVLSVWLFWLFLI